MFAGHLQMNGGGINNINDGGDVLVGSVTGLLELPSLAKVTLTPDQERKDSVGQRPTKVFPACQNI